MLTLLQPLQLDFKDGDASLILWLCHGFDMEYSFRRPLSEIARILASESAVLYTLPPEEPKEDFIEGDATWGNRVYGVYFERMFGLVQFSSSVPEDIQILHDSLSPHCVVEVRRDA